MSTPVTLTAADRAALHYLVEVAKRELHRSERDLQQCKGGGSALTSSIESDLDRCQASIDLLQRLIKESR